MAKGVFRVVGNLVPGYLTVQYVRHCDDSPRFAVPARAIFDESWIGIDRIPLEMVTLPDRFPNTLLRVTVQSGTHEIIQIERQEAG